MSDLIDRQAAIDICRAPHMRNADCSDFEMAIMMLPPAQPSAGDCWGCNCPKMERLAQPAPSQVAADIARIVENGQDMRVIAQPGRIKGHWIIRETSFGDTEARCSHCGFTTLVDEPGNGLHMVSDLNFCPNCGAEMEVTE